MVLIARKERNGLFVSLFVIELGTDAAAPVLCATECACGHVIVSLLSTPVGIFF